MAFKIDLSDTFFFPVTVQIAKDGKHDTAKFDAEFKRLSKTENREIFDRLPRTGHDVDVPITDDEILDLVFVGWKGVVDSDGVEIPYSETARTKVLDIQGVSNGIVQSWMNSITGARSKN